MTKAGPDTVKAFALDGSKDTIAVYPANKLGDVPTVLSLLQSGAIERAIVPATRHGRPQIIAALDQNQTVLHAGLQLCGLLRHQMSSGMDDGTREAAGQIRTATVEGAQAMPNGATLVREGSDGLRAEFSHCAARLLRLDVPVRDGGSAQVVIGSALDGSQPDGDTWGGTICGRFANRIADASFELDGVRYSLPANHETSSLHGGPEGFGLRGWNVEAADDTLVFSLNSPDGEMGYPGMMEVEAVYGISGATLWLEITATTDKPTIVNLTQHRTIPPSMTA